MSDTTVSEPPKQEGGETTEVKKGGINISLIIIIIISVVAAIFFILFIVFLILFIIQVSTNSSASSYEDYKLVKSATLVTSSTIDISKYSKGILIKNAGTYTITGIPGSEFSIDSPPTEEQLEHLNYAVYTKCDGDITLNLKSTYIVSMVSSGIVNLGKGRLTINIEDDSGIVAYPKGDFTGVILSFGPLTISGSDSLFLYNGGSDKNAIVVKDKDLTIKGKPSLSYSDIKHEINVGAGSLILEEGALSLNGGTDSVIAYKGVKVTGCYLWIDNRYISNMIDTPSISITGGIVVSPYSYYSSLPIEDENIPCVIIDLYYSFIVIRKKGDSKYLFGCYCPYSLRIYSPLFQIGVEYDICSATPPSDSSYSQSELYPYSDSLSFNNMVPVAHFKVEAGTTEITPDSY